MFKKTEVGFIKISAKKAYSLKTYSPLLVHYDPMGIILSQL